MILMIDNYDSFTYNLYQYLSELDKDVRVVRNDELTCADIEKWQPTHIVLSPGPGRPQNAGIMPHIIAEFHKKIPILGVCLGHQALGEFFGARLIHAPQIMHGKISTIDTVNHPMFDKIPKKFDVTRYHSLALIDLPEELQATAWSEKDATLMAFAHSSLPIWGVQFHPESICSEFGHQILINFIKLRKSNFN